MKYICKFLLKVLGWKAMEPPVPEAKGIILGVPHTSHSFITTPYLKTFLIDLPAFDNLILRFMAFLMFLPQLGQNSTS